MEPIPETWRAADDLDPVADDALLPERLRAMADRAREIVPDLVGVSVSAVRPGITMTVVSSSADPAVLDGMQYLVGGPCLQAAAEDRILQKRGSELFDEDAWRLFAEATACHDVRSTLSLPVVDAGRVVGSVNLYGGSGTCFEGGAEALAELFGAWAPGAVSNADLSFTTRLEAQRAPERLRDQARVETAIGILAAEGDGDVGPARHRLERAAAQAEVSVLELAEAVIEASERQHRDH